MKKLREVLKDLEEDQNVDIQADKDEAEDKPKEAAADEAAAETEGEKTDDTKIEEAAKSAADKIVSAMNLDKLTKLFELAEKVSNKSTGVAKVVTERDVKKAVNELTKEEKIAGFTKALFQKDVAVLKALSEGTAADGGYLFPNDFRAEIIKILMDTPRMRGLVRVIPMRKDVLDIPVESAKATVFWGAENAAITTTTADFGNAQLTAYRMNSIMYMSRELVDDASEVGVVDLIVQQFADAVGQEEDKVIIQGSGSGQPTGLTGASGEHETTCSGNLDFDDVINCFYALPQQYRGQASFLVATANVRELRQLKDSQGRYLWVDSVAAGVAPTILGRPVYENTWVPEATIFFGDYKRAYFLGDREQMSVEMTTEGAGTWEKHQVGIKVTERIAGTPVLGDALATIITIP